MRILYLESWNEVREYYTEKMKRWRHDVTEVSTANDLLQQLDRDQYDVVITPYKGTGSPLSGIEVLQLIRTKDSSIAVIMLTAWMPSGIERGVKDLGGILIQKSMDDDLREALGCLHA